MIRRGFITKRRRRGQAAVETMLLTFMVMIVLLGLVHLFSLTWASQNAHIRAREAVFHGDAYLTGAKGDSQFTQPSSAPFDPSMPGVSGNSGNYTVAEDSITPFDFSATAKDNARDDLFGSQEIEVTAKITSTPPSP